MREIEKMLQQLYGGGWVAVFEYTWLTYYSSSGYIVTGTDLGGNVCTTK